MPKRKFQIKGISEDMRMLITVLLLVFAYPAGFILMWFWTKWKYWVKCVVSIPAALFIVMIVLFFMAFLFNFGNYNFTKLGANKNKAKCVYQCQDEEDKADCERNCLLESIK
jgi:hypothetical protein